MVRPHPRFLGQLEYDHVEDHPLSLNHTLKAAARHVLEADLNFLAPMDEKPFNYTYPPPAGTPPSNAVTDPHRVRLLDMRLETDTLSLDQEGFELLHHHSEVDDFDDPAKILEQYYPETAALLKAHTGAERVLIFDHTIRRRLAGVADRAPGIPRQPVHRVHVDQTDRSGPQRVRDLLGDAAAADWLAGRIQIVNVWRPINGPVQEQPLAVCDAMTVHPEDLVGSDLIYRDRRGETYAVTYSDGQQWYYAPEMTNDEVLLLKCYDSRRDGRARFTPHTAFQDPTTPANPRPRESIELRAVLFHSL